MSWTKERKEKWVAARKVSLAKDIVGKHSDVSKSGWTDERRKSQEKSWDNKFPINWDFFKVPSNDLYYFLGYVAGDGVCCSNELDFKVSSSDGYIIEKFRDLISPKSKLCEEFYTRRGVVNAGKMTCLTLGRRYFWKVVNTFDVKNPDIFKRIPVVFMPSFIRGFFDSDGSIEARVKKTCYNCSVRFKQKDKLYLEALDVVFRNFGLNPAPIVSDGVCHVLRLRLEDTLVLLSIIYVNKGDLYLRRKYYSYNKVVESRVNVLKNRHIRYSEAMKRNWALRRESSQAVVY